MCAACALQWGRGFSTAEMRLIRIRYTILPPASMGPRFFNRGNVTDIDELRKPCSASMGPRFFNRGNRELSDRCGINLAASMGPRFFNRGNALGIATHVFGAQASMGPRFFNRGNLPWPIASRRHHGASMGPRFFNRGNWRTTRRRALRVASFNGAAVFQPRKFASPERTMRPLLVLQWGRGFSTAEIGENSVETSVAEAASMGPRFFNRGNHARHAVVCGVHTASMGPRFFNRGNSSA